MSAIKDDSGRDIPNPCPQGCAIVSDKKGAGVQVSELHQYLDHGGAGGLLVTPVHGATRGPMMAGSLMGQVRDGSIQIHAFTAYPERDGKPHIQGSARYPHQYIDTTFTRVDRTFYNDQTAIGMKLLAEAQAKAAAPVAVSKESK